MQDWKNNTLHVNSNFSVLQVGPLLVNPERSSPEGNVKSNQYTAIRNKNGSMCWSVFTITRVTDMFMHQPVQQSSSMNKNNANNKAFAVLFIFINTTIRYYTGSIHYLLRRIKLSRWTI